MRRCRSLGQHAALPMLHQSHQQRRGTMCARTTHILAVYCRTLQYRGCSSYGWRHLLAREGSKVLFEGVHIDCP